MRCYTSSTDTPATGPRSGRSPTPRKELVTRLIYRTVVSADMSDETTVAIACQGGGSHTAVTAGVLRETLLELPERYEITALSGTSGGAICAAIAWDGLRRDDPGDARDRLAGFWDELAADTGPELLANDAALWGRRLTGGVPERSDEPQLRPGGGRGQARLATDHRAIRDLRQRRAGVAAPPVRRCGRGRVGDFRSVRGRRGRRGLADGLDCGPHIVPVRRGRRRDLLGRALLTEPPDPPVHDRSPTRGETRRDLDRPY
ncbi:hypothetical protein BRC64_12780 [Halobacteriales archaeon QH_10_67_22]|nr:MAG: hypothetical protein BRC64_12780 [Halobacteriales archaeon QH_10_67_22]